MYVILFAQGGIDMKNINILFIGLSSLFLLIGCGPKKENDNPKEITAEEFNAILTKAEEPNYSGATIHATEKIVGTGDFAQNRFEERTEEYTHYADTDAWIVEDGDSLLRKYIYDFSSLESLKSWVENPELSYSYKFYSDLTVKIKEDGTFVDNMMGANRTVDIDSQMTITINKFGYLASLKGTYNQNITQVSGDTTYRGTKSGESNIEITYR